MDKNEELQKWLNDDRYVQRKELEIMWNVGAWAVNSFLKYRKIKTAKKLNFQQGSFVFYDKQQCVNARAIYDAKIQELPKCLNDTNLIQQKELALEWGITKSAVASFLGRRNIKPIKKINAGGANSFAFYDRTECERARPFINQPEQKEVEKVEEVNLLESELDSEELATENGSALNDAELAAIITACKDPVDKIMILSALCFGVKSGELSSLNLRDISGADICLQSPSGVVKMRIPKQYEDARTELLIYYVDNGNNLSGDMPVFLNRSGIRMTRQGLNNRMKSVSESANIGRDVKLSDLRATFAQNIYKKTEKNIASVHKYLRLSENTNIMGYLLETQSKEQKTMPVDLMNSLTASYQVKEPPTIAEPKEQTPDIIPADTIDLFTMSELESEFKNRGVELTTEVIAKINASDMLEMQHIATMLRGNTKTIAIRLSVLNDIAGQLREVKPVIIETKKDVSKLKRISISDAAESAGITREQARYWSSLLGIEIVKDGRVSYLPSGADALLEQMAVEVKKNKAPNVAAAELKIVYSPEKMWDNTAKELDYIEKMQQQIESLSKRLADLERVGPEYTTMTEGPWIAVGRMVEHENDKIADVCSCNPEHWGQIARPHAESMANATVIAAVPHMIKLLEKVSLCDDEELDDIKSDIDDFLGKMPITRTF